jgi:hypothetical protein
MAADSNRHWLLFAGGVIIGSATAAGAAYALTSALISKQQQQQQQYTDQQIQQLSQARNRWVRHTCFRSNMLYIFMYPAMILHLQHTFACCVVLIGLPYRPGSPTRRSRVRPVRVPHTPSGSPVVQQQQQQIDRRQHQVRRCLMSPWPMAMFNMQRPWALLCSLICRCWPFSETLFL